MQKPQKKEIDTWAHKILSMIPNSIPTYTILTKTTTTILIIISTEKMEGF